ncbi:MAG: hypothetical protein ACYSUK_12805 [Planctomycetota bacterium]|jgi:hypothetical protein
MARTNMSRHDCAFILGHNKRSPAIQFYLSQIEHLQVFTSPPDYQDLLKIRIFLKSGSEIEIDDPTECYTFAEHHKREFSHRGGHFLYI